MLPRTRREFLQDVGKGVVAATVGTSLSADLGFSTAFAEDGTDRLNFGALEPLVGVMQETNADRLLPLVVQRLQQGTALRDLVAAATLANARTFGGEDYVGFHTIMAMSPAYHMASELPEARRALPVLKVLYRNASRIQEFGGPAREVLHPVSGGVRLPADRVAGEILRDVVRSRNMDEAERTFATIARTPEDALNNVLYEVADAADVHRVVLPYRAYDLLKIVGREQAHTMLRQSVRFCVRAEQQPRYVEYFRSVRTVVPRLLDQYRLEGRAFGTRVADDRWLEETSLAIFCATPERAAEIAAAALADGMSPESVSEALSLAANQLLLRDNGRPRDEAPNKPAGSVHGDSIGLHGCDTVNAWRNLARAANRHNKAVCLILGAWQVARDRSARGDFVHWQPYPRQDARDAVRDLANDRLLPTLEDAIRNRDQARAAAVAWKYGEAGLAPRPLWDLLLRYAVSEDGALHGEKFYRTATEEYLTTRPAFRWRQLIALARVTASEHGYAAPGYADACRLLSV